MEKGQPNFWQALKAKKAGEPILVLAPMADVTDAAFRRVIAKYGRPDVMWTEFVSADGLARAPKEGREKLLRDLVFTEAERPIVAQFFTSTPAHMERAAALAAELGFDGIDINMGCPDKSIEKQCAGAAMMKDPKRAYEVIRAAQRGAKGLPVSVKTRIGYNTNELSTWLPALLETKPAVITIHARTRKEMSLVPARWEHVREAVEIRDRVQADLPVGERTLIFGNGDVRDLADAREKALATRADGVMLGRAIFGNPWLFDSNTKGGGNGAAAGAASISGVSVPERLRVMVEHTALFETLLGDIKNFSIMKKHYKAYVNGWDGAKELRLKLMETHSAAQVRDIVEEYLKTFSA